MAEGYTVGISAGLWEIKRGYELLGIPKKIEWALTNGVPYTEVPLDSITEFNEPDLKKKVEKATSLGIKFGIHGESYATTSLDSMPLASALEVDYGRAHERLLQTIEGSGKIGALYVNMHTTESTPFILLETKLEVSRILDFFGRPLEKFLNENPDIFDWAIRQSFIMEGLRHGTNIRSEEQVYEEMVVRYKESLGEKQSPDQKQLAEIRKQAEKQYIKSLKDLLTLNARSPELQYGIEKVAYYCVAKWMMKHKDDLWMKIVGKDIKDDDLHKTSEILKWVPAVAAKYIWGHFMMDQCPGKSEYKDPKPLLAKYKMYWTFETPMTTKGYEGYMRLSQIHHIYALVTSIKSDWIMFTLDMEHVMGNNLDPTDQIAKLPPRAGERLLVMHLTVPHPMNPSHLPIQFASEAQYYIYQRLYELRQKGFTKGYLLYERGSEEVKESVVVIRMMKEFLEKNVLPKDLPPRFFGMPTEGVEFDRQMVAISEHAFEPLKGMMSIPEEEHGFFGQHAVEKKGKGEQWKKEQYR